MLGLVEMDENEKMVKVAPVDSNMVFVEEVSPQELTRDTSEEKLDRLMKAVDDLKRQSASGVHRPNEPTKGVTKEGSAHETSIPPAATSDTRPEPKPGQVPGVDTPLQTPPPREDWRHSED